MTGTNYIVNVESLQVEAELTGQAEIPQSVGWIDDSRYVAVHNRQKFVWDLNRPTVLALPLPDSPPGSDGAVVSNGSGRIWVHNGESIETRGPSGETVVHDLPESLQGSCPGFEHHTYNNELWLFCIESINGPPGVELSYGVFDWAENVVTVEGTNLPPDFALNRASLSPDGSMLAATASLQGFGLGSGGLVALIDTASGQYIHEPVQLDDWTLVGIAWTPDGEFVLTGGQDGEVLFLDPSTWEVADRVVVSADAAITDIDITNDGSAALVATEAGVVGRIDLVERELIGEPLTGAASQFQSVTESPDGRLVAATGRDAALRVWDVESGRLVGEKLEGGGAFIAHFIDDDRILTGGSEAGRMVWDLSLDRLIERACDLAGRHLTEEELVVFGDDLVDGDRCAG